MIKTIISRSILALVASFAWMSQGFAEEISWEEPSMETPFYEVELSQCDSYRYFSVGVGPIIFIPNVGVGYRVRHNQYGCDASFSFSSIGYAHQLSAHCVGHYYFSQRQNSAYVGAGLIGSGIFTNHGKGLCTLSPDFVLGKELETCGERRHFIEMHVAAPTLCIRTKHSEAFYLPLMYIKYGISF